VKLKEREKGKEVLAGRKVWLWLLSLLQKLKKDDNNEKYFRNKYRLKKQIPHFPFENLIFLDFKTIDFHMIRDENPLNYDFLSQIWIERT
jgi:hypothetical protein